MHTKEMGQTLTLPKYKIYVLQCDFGAWVCDIVLASNRLFSHDDYFYQIILKPAIAAGKAWPRGYKTFSCSVEHEFFPAHKC